MSCPTGRSRQKHRPAIRADRTGVEDDGARHVDDQRVHDLFLKQVQEVVAGKPGFGGPLAG